MVVRRRSLATLTCCISVLRRSLLPQGRSWDRRGRGGSRASTLRYRAALHVSHGGPAQIPATQPPRIASNQKDTVPGRVRSPPRGIIGDVEGQDFHRRGKFNASPLKHVLDVAISSRPREEVQDKHAFSPRRARDGLRGRGKGSKGPRRKRVLTGNVASGRSGAHGRANRASRGGLGEILRFARLSVRLSFLPDLTSVLGGLLDGGNRGAGSTRALASDVPGKVFDKASLGPMIVQTGLAHRALGPGRGV